LSHPAALIVGESASSTLEMETRPRTNTEDDRTRVASSVSLCSLASLSSELQTHRAAVRASHLHLSPSSGKSSSRIPLQPLPELLCLAMPLLRCRLPITRLHFEQRNLHLRYVTNNSREDRTRSDSPSAPQCYTAPGARGSLRPQLPFALCSLPAPASHKDRFRCGGRRW
jgi:hypothetical protein